MKYVLNVFVCLVLGLVGTMAEAKRVALVMGNGDYMHAESLRNPVNDATAMADKFRSLGFEVITGLDLDYLGMQNKMREFARAASGAELATVYYAGHGIAVNGINYLVPIDAALDDPIDWEFQVFALDEFMRQAERASGANLFFIDACRDNPLAGMLAAAMGDSTRSIASRGLAPVEAGSNGAGTAIVFATKPGEVAQDGAGNHSPFTASLLKHIASPNRGISEIMTSVVGEVYESTERKQRPWMNASLTQPIILNAVEGLDLTPSAPEAESAVLTAPAPSGNASLEVQKYMFDLAVKSNDPLDYQAYLNTFPQGLFAQQARNAMTRLQVAANPTPETNTTIPVVGGTTEASGKVEDVAYLDLTRSLATPLKLEVTDAVRQMVSNQATDAALALNREQRVALQDRLNAMGHNVGRADGSIGPKSRAGITAWQLANGLTANGFLNQAQLHILIANSEQVYTTYLASKPVYTPRPSGGGNGPTIVSGGGGSRPSGGGGRTGGGNDVGGAVAAGVVLGIIGSKILGR